MKNYTLIGQFPNGAMKRHISNNLDDLKYLATNWSNAQAECAILVGPDVVIRYLPKSIKSPGQFY